MKRDYRLRGWFTEAKRSLIDIVLSCLLIFFSAIFLAVGLIIGSEAPSIMSHVIGILVTIVGAVGILLSGLLLAEMHTRYRCPHCGALIRSHSFRRGVTTITCSYCLQPFAADRKPQPVINVVEPEDLLRVYVESEKRGQQHIRYGLKWLSIGIVALSLLWIAIDHFGMGVLIFPLIGAVAAVMDGSAQLVRSLISWTMWRIRKFETTCPLCASWRVLKWADWKGTRIECLKCGQTAIADPEESCGFDTHGVSGC